MRKPTKAEMRHVVQVYPTTDEARHKLTGGGVKCPCGPRFTPAGHRGKLRQFATIHRNDY